MAEEHVFIVLSNPTEGREEEFNAWYDDPHLGEMTAIPGFVSARRYKLSPTQLEGFGGAAGHRYVAMYTIEGDAEEAFAELAKRLGDGTVSSSPALDTDGLMCLNFAALGETRRAQPVG